MYEGKKLRITSIIITSAMITLCIFLTLLLNTNAGEKSYAANVDETGEIFTCRGYVGGEEVDEGTSCNLWIEGKSFYCMDYRKTLPEDKKMDVFDISDKMDEGKLKKFGATLYLYDRDARSASYMERQAIVWTIAGELWNSEYVSGKSKYIYPDECDSYDRDLLEDIYDMFFDNSRELTEIAEGITVTGEVALAGSGDYQRIISIDYLYNPYGNVKLQKKSENAKIIISNDNYSLAGATFELKKTDDPACRYTMITDDNGYAFIDDIKAGTYKVTEISAPSGFLRNTDIPDVVVKSGDTATISVDDKPLYNEGLFKIKKIGNTDTTFNYEGEEGDGTLGGAKFKVGFYESYIKDFSENEEDAKGDEDADLQEFIRENEPLKEWIFETDEEGIICFDEGHKVWGDDLYSDGSGAAVLPLGSIIVQEIEAPKGYIRDDKLIYGEINNDGEKAVFLQGHKTNKTNETTENNVIPYMDIYIEPPRLKSKANTVNVSGDESIIDTLKDNDAVNVKDKDIKTVNNTDAVTIKDNDTITVKNNIILGDLRIIKTDLELGRSEAVGSAVLKDCSFEVISRCKGPVFYNGTRIDPGEKVTEQKTEKYSESGMYEFRVENLPYGTYDIYEINAGEGYVTSPEPLTVTIRGQSEVHEYNFPNKVKRGDYTFNKSVDGKQRLSTAFKITLFRDPERTMPMESHLVTTDENGFFSSKMMADSQRFNINDKYLEGDIQMKDLDSNSSVYFSKGESSVKEAREGETSDVNDPEEKVYVPDASRGALPYGYYRIEELPTDTNEGVSLLAWDFKIEKDGVEVKAGTFDDEGNNEKEEEPPTETKKEEVPAEEADTKLMSDKVETGDKSNLTLILSALVVSCGCIVAILKFKKLQ